MCITVHMRHYIILLIAMTSLSGCANKPIIHRDPTLLKYVEAIEEHTGLDLYKDNYTLVFDTDTKKLLKDWTTGQCRSINGNPTRIIISESYWNSFDTEERLSLIAHEVLHCSFRLGHVKDTKQYTGRLMSPYTSDSAQCVKNFGMIHCIEEAFAQSEAGQLEDISKSEHIH